MQDCWLVWDTAVLCKAMKAYPNRWQNLCNGTRLFTTTKKTGKEKITTSIGRKGGMRNTKHILMAWCKTVVSPLITQWRYHSLATSHWDAEALHSSQTSHTTGQATKSRGASHDGKLSVVALVQHLRKSKLQSYLPKLPSTVKFMI